MIATWDCLLMRSLIWNFNGRIVYRLLSTPDKCEKMVQFHLRLPNNAAVAQRQLCPRLERPTLDVGGW